MERSLDRSRRDPLLLHHSSSGSRLTAVSGAAAPGDELVPAKGAGHSAPTWLAESKSPAQLALASADAPAAFSASFMTRFD